MSERITVTAGIVMTPAVHVFRRINSKKMLVIA